MDRNLGAELLAILNRARSDRDIVDYFTVDNQQIISIQLARAILQARNASPGQKFTSVPDLRNVPGVTDRLLERVAEVLAKRLGLLQNDWPVLLFPVRLETRILPGERGKKDLWVRIYPDQISVDSHDPRLTDEELKGGKAYWDEIKDLRAGDSGAEEQRRAAWRRLAQGFGPERAAWVATTMRAHAANPGSIPTRPQNEAWIVEPKLIGLPDHFVVYAYRKDELIHSQKGRDIPSSLSLLPGRSGGTVHSRWTTDLAQAEQDGMAVRIKDLSSTDLQKGFSRVLVCGLRKAGPAAGAKVVEYLIDHHHYSTGVEFLAPGTPTNNTNAERSGHSELAEDRERSYDIEISGPANWEEPRINARRLGRALGLGEATEVLRYLAGANAAGDAYALEMQTALWPATGDYLLRYLLPGIVTPEGLQRLATHFVNFVRAGGPYSVLRVGKQPYGILPVTGVRKKTTEHELGWQASGLDSDQTGARFDTRLHDILEQLHGKWYPWAGDPKRVPRIMGTDDPDKELLEVLAMEPVSVEYRTRPFVDQSAVGFLLNATKADVYSENPFVGRSPIYWVEKWRQMWERHCREQALAWSALTGVDQRSFENAELLQLFGWWNDVELDLGVTKFASDEAQEHPLNYLRALCEGTDRGSAATLLRELLQRSLKVAPKSSITPAKVKDAICGLVSPSLLDFFNTASRPEQIAARITDDPGHGKPSPRAYGVRWSLARKIIEKRESLPNRRFESLEQIDAVLGVGEDTLHDITHAFRDQKLDPDIDLLFRQTLDLCSHRLDAWITSLATKRLEAMRKAKPEGLYIGAYGYIENLKPDSGQRQSQGYFHAPSAAQAKAAAVLHNAYLSHKDGSGQDGPNPFRVNLTSERVRRALRIVQGVRAGQPLGALLGYQFERALHERRLGRYIDEFRAAFPLVANKETPPADGQAAEALAARNVVDGLALARWFEDRNRTDITPPDPAALRVVVQRLDDQHPSELVTEVKALNGSLDAVSDLLLYEGVYHAVQGNYEHSGAALDAMAGSATPPEIESVNTPISGKSLGHRVCLLFPPGPDNAPQSARVEAEPRLAAWLAGLIDDLSQIGCRFAFRSPRVNINADEVNITQLTAIPGVSRTDAEAIINYRIQHGPRASPDDIPELTETAVRALRRWAMTAQNPDEAHYFERIDLNTASRAELTSVLNVSGDEAKAIIDNRRYRRFEELEAVPGIGPELVNRLRPWTTTGAETLSLEELGLEPIDLLYLSATIPRAVGLLDTSSSPPTAEATEIEQRISCWVRNEFGLSSDTHIDISFASPNGFGHGIGEVLELGRQILNTLGAGKMLRPPALALPAETQGVTFTASDVEALNDRVRKVRTRIQELGQRLLRPTGDGSDGTATPSETLADLLEAGRCNISGAVPRAMSDPELETLQGRVAIELLERIEACDTILADVAQQASHDGKIEFLVSAIKSLLGESFVVLPVFTPPGNDNLASAFNQASLLVGQDETRLRLWLQQLAQAHPPLRELEDSLIVTDIWRQPLRTGKAPALALRAAQLPFSDTNRWVGLDDAERGGDAFNKDIDSDRGMLSIVAAVGMRAGAAWNPGQSPQLAGLLLDQWDEVIPSDKVTTGISFHYDGPGSQAPQCLLLAVPSQRGDQHAYWTVDELAEIVKDTMDLAKVRAVDPDAMGAVDDEVSSDPGAGLMLPALMLPADPTRPDWVRQTVFNTIEDWSDAVVRPEDSASFEELDLGTSLGPDHTVREFKIACSGSSDLNVWRLLAAGESPEDSNTRKCVVCAGDLKIRLPPGRSADILLLRVGWAQPGGSIELYTSRGDRIMVDGTNARPVRLVEYPNPQTISAVQLNVIVTVPDIQQIKITGRRGPKFVLMIGILD